MAVGRDGPVHDGRFMTTDWGLVAAAAGGDEEGARRALADLCEAYWYPLYAYIRRRGYPADRAQDLTQGFFEGLLRRDFLGGVAPEKGRFRAFLLASLQNYLARRRDHDCAQKRGGGRPSPSIDWPKAEGRYAFEPAHELTAERFFERRWALTLLERTLDRLGDEVRRAGKGNLFDRLGPALLGADVPAPYAEVAADLGMTEGAVKVAAHRLRRRYGELLRAEVARTVEGPGEVEDEIRDLFRALGG